MTPGGFGVRVALLAWIALLAGAVVFTAAEAMLFADTDPFVSVVWGLYLAALTAVPLSRSMPLAG